MHGLVPCHISCLIRQLPKFILVWTMGIATVMKVEELKCWHITKIHGTCKPSKAESDLASFVCGKLWTKFITAATLCMCMHTVYVLACSIALLMQWYVLLLVLYVNRYSSIVELCFTLLSRAVTSTVHVDIRLWQYWQCITENVYINLWGSTVHEWDTPHTWSNIHTLEYVTHDYTNSLQRSLQTPAAQQWWPQFQKYQMQWS